MREFYVWGGVFRSNELAWAEPGPSPASLERGTFELHGPYPTEAEARRAQKEFTMRNVDVCAHRMVLADVSKSDAEDWTNRLRAACPA